MIISRDTVNMLTEQSIFIGSFLLLISILLSKVSSKLGIPSLILFLVLGMLAGSEGIGGIYFDDSTIAQFIGNIALVFIIFSGGLDTKWKEVKPILGRGILLSTIGVFITAIALGFFINWITDFTFMESLLIGSIVSSTDAAAVFAIFRSRGKQKLKHNLEPTLEFESASNDPMAYFLTTTIIFLILNPTTSIESAFILLIKSLSLGAILGVVFGKGMVFVTNKVSLHIPALYPIRTMAMAILTFSVSYLVGGNGLISVYIAALILGNSRFEHKKTQIQFFDGIAWLMQIIMFITLGLLVFPSQIVPVIGVGLIISFFLILVARPLAVVLCILPFKVPAKDQIFISLVGIRGAVPIILATFPIAAGLNSANMIFNIVFFVTITSALLQGSTVNVLADYLGLSGSKNDE